MTKYGIEFTVSGVVGESVEDADEDETTEEQE